MLRVGWKMVKDHPLTGVGPGRIEALYVNYLAPQEPVPAYHGHLHDNLVQLAAEFGLPVVVAALAFAVALWKELRKQWKTARDRETLFLCRVSILALIGFLASGLFRLHLRAFTVLDCGQLCGSHSSLTNDPSSAFLGRCQDCFARALRLESHVSAPE
jgi:O-antigen ligase